MSGVERRRRAFFFQAEDGIRDLTVTGVQACAHPSTGDCNGCHTTTPTFALHVSGGAKPSNHIPTNAPCAQGRTTAGDYAPYVQGATGDARITSGCAEGPGPGRPLRNIGPPPPNLA